MSDVQTKSEEQLAQLKAFYESEKQRLEQRYNDEKDRSAGRHNQMMEEHRLKMRDVANNHEGEIELIQHKLRQAVEENK